MLHHEEILDYLDNNFDIPDDGVNSAIEGLNEEDFDEENDLLPEVADSPDEDDEDINLIALDIVENGVQENSRGRPSNASLNDFGWSSERSDVDIPGFSQAVGPTNIMPRESSAIDFFQLRPLRSMTTSFQTTSFHPLVTSFHQTVTSFQRIVTSFQV